MQESNILVGDVSIKQQQNEVYINIKGQFMMKLDILVSNVSIMQLKKEI